MSKEMLIAAFGIVLATSVSAEEIRWKPETEKPGDYVVINQTQAGRVTHVFMGKVGNAYVIESYKGKVKPGERDFTTYLDQDGNYLKFVYPDGSMYKYQPHDCKRVLGTCRYTEIAPDGTRQKLTHVARAIRGGFEFQVLHEDGEVKLEGQVMLDEHGNAGDGFTRGGSRVEKYKFVKSYFQ